MQTGTLTLSWSNCYCGCVWVAIWSSTNLTCSVQGPGNWTTKAKSSLAAIKGLGCDLPYGQVGAGGHTDLLICLQWAG